MIGSDDFQVRQRVRRLAQRVGVTDRLRLLEQYPTRELAIVEILGAILDRVEALEVKHEDPPP